MNLIKYMVCIATLSYYALPLQASLKTIATKKSSYESLAEKSVNITFMKKAEINRLFNAVQMRCTEINPAIDRAIIHEMNKAAASLDRPTTPCSLGDGKFEILSTMASVKNYLDKNRDRSDVFYSIGFDMDTNNVSFEASYLTKSSRNILTKQN